MTKKWIQAVFKGHPKGSLHHALHIPISKKIPEGTLIYIINHVGTHAVIYGHPVTITPLLRKRAHFLLNIDRMHRR